MNSPLKIATSAMLCIFLGACASNQDSDELASGSTAESTGAAEQQVAVNDNRDDPNAIRCKRYAQTGSRLGKKVCKTNAEWDEAARAAKEATDTIQREALQGRGSYGGS